MFRLFSDTRRVSDVGVLACACRLCEDAHGPLGQWPASLTSLHDDLALSLLPPLQPARLGSSSHPVSDCRQHSSALLYVVMPAHNYSISPPWLTHYLSPVYAMPQALDLSGRSTNEEEVITSVSVGKAAHFSEIQLGYPSLLLLQRRHAQQTQGTEEKEREILQIYA